MSRCSAFVVRNDSNVFSTVFIQSPSEAIMRVISYCSLPELSPRTISVIFYSINSHKQTSKFSGYHASSEPGFQFDRVSDEYLSKATFLIKRRGKYHQIKKKVVRILIISQNCIWMRKSAAQMHSDTFLYFYLFKNNRSLYSRVVLTLLLLYTRTV